MFAAALCWTLDAAQFSRALVASELHATCQVALSA